MIWILAGFAWFIAGSVCLIMGVSVMFAVVKRFGQIDANLEQIARHVGNKQREARP